MDLFVGYAGVALTFVIMMSVFMLILIKSNDINWKLKAVLIPFVLWFSVALYHVPQNFMGWPTEKWSIQHQVIILKTHVVEDDSIYFWVIDYNLDTVRTLVDPRHTFWPTTAAIPRGYRVKYNSDLHERLVAARKKMKRQGRGSMMMSMDRLQSLSAFNRNEPLFELFDPAEVLRKADTDQH